MPNDVVNEPTSAEIRKFHLDFWKGIEEEFVEKLSDPFNPVTLQHERLSAVSLLRAANALERIADVLERGK